LLAFRVLETEETRPFALVKKKDRLGGNKQYEIEVEDKAM